MALGPPGSGSGETALSRQSTVIENPTTVASPGATEPPLSLLHSRGTQELRWDRPYLEYSVKVGGIPAGQRLVSQGARD